jgi:LmbE family N-acetylglucosaminyl deacetylase
VGDAGQSRLLRTYVLAGSPSKETVQSPRRAPVESLKLGRAARFAGLPPSSAGTMAVQPGASKLRGGHVFGLMVGDRPLEVLCLGAHPDDIEIGCGGALLRLGRRSDVSVTGLVLTGQGERAAEAASSLPAFFPGAKVEVAGLQDGRLPAQWQEVKEVLEDLGSRCEPDIIFAPRPDDAHQDHRLIGSLATTVWRGSLVLHYEIPKWDGDLTSPTHFVELTESEARTKVDLLNRCFRTQVSRDWWDDELFLGLMRLRGVESRARYAEGFFSTKVLVDLLGPAGS